MDFPAKKTTRVIFPLKKHGRVGFPGQENHLCDISTQKHTLAVFL
jgi:hypothetical protein